MALRAAKVAGMWRAFEVARAIVVAAAVPSARATTSTEASVTARRRLLDGSPVMAVPPRAK